VKLQYSRLCDTVALLEMTVKLECSRLCVTAALLEMTVKLQYSRLCVTAALLEVTVKLQYSRLCVTAALLEVTVKLVCSRLCVTAALLQVTVKLQYSRLCNKAKSSYIVLVRSSNSAVGAPNSCGLDGPGFNCRQGQENSSSPKHSRLTVGPTQPPIPRHRYSFPAVTRLDSDVVHSPQSTAEVKNERSYTSTLSVCLH